MQDSLENEIKNIVESHGYNLYDIDILRDNQARIFRISICSEKGITHDDCQKISEIISPLLDVYDPIVGEYFLEVSSPGLERELKKPRHFALSLNQEIEIILLDKTKKRGILTGAHENGFSLDNVPYAYKDIKKAKSVFEL